MIRAVRVGMSSRISHYSTRQRPWLKLRPSRASTLINSISPIPRGVSCFRGQPTYRAERPICRKVLKIMIWEVPPADWLIL